MKIRTLLIATTLVASMTGAAFAQNGDAAANQDQTKKSGMTQGSSATGAKAMKPTGTTGSATSSKNDASTQTGPDGGKPSKDK